MPQNNSSEICFDFNLKNSICEARNKSEEKAFYISEYPLITQPTDINKDLICIPPGQLKFKIKNDLDHLGLIAEDRTQRRRLSANIRESAEASKSEHQDANRNIDR